MELEVKGKKYQVLQNVRELGGVWCALAWGIVRICTHSEKYVSDWVLDIFTY